jgi:hypothetical protein
MSEKSKNDVAWEKLFEEHNILEKISKTGEYKISAKVINTKREARLMTKFDHHINLPTIFKKNDLTIQPDSRGTYVIGKFESYKKLLKNSFISIQEIQFPENIQTLNPINIYSEAASILCAYNAGIIKDLLGQEVFFTVSGRMSTGKFDYLINNTELNTPCMISVDSSQCEIDGGFEGDDIFAIIEAKNQDVDDFLIRQLYYPYRLWKSKTDKQVIPIFLSYSNDIFSFYIYKFKDDNNYNSIELVEQKRYQIGSNDIELKDITDMLERVKIIPEPERVPFPQANVFARVVDLLMQIYSNGLLTKEDIIANYHYYTRAAMYLGFIERKYTRDLGVTYLATERGVGIVQKTSKGRNMEFIKYILRMTVFNQALRLYLHQAQRPNQEQIIKIMKIANIKLGKDKSETIPRRAQSVIAWIDWIMELTQQS